MVLRQLLNKLRGVKPQRVSFLDNSLMREAFAGREPGEIDFMHFSSEALEVIAVQEAGTARGEGARAELAARHQGSRRFPDAEQPASS